MTQEQHFHLTRLFKISLTLGILIFLNILFGPLVRATDSGLACPDWPLCHGKVLPPADFQIWMEVGHRFYSGFISLLLLYEVIYIFKTEELREQFGGLALNSLVVIVLQIILGALTVTKLLHPTTVNAHLLNAVLFLLLTVTISLKSQVMLKSKDDEFALFGWGDIFTKKGMLLLFTFFFTYFQLYLGGRVSSHYAGLACPDWPTCNGLWFPPLEEAVRFQMEHRYMGYFILLLVIGNLLIAYFQRYDRRSRYYSRLALYLCGLQILLGVLNVLWKLPTLLTALHTGVGVALLTTIFVALYYRISARGTKEKVKVPISMQSETELA
jgi:heme a synthase